MMAQGHFEGIHITGVGNFGTVQGNVESRVVQGAGSGAAAVEDGAKRELPDPGPSPVSENITVRFGFGVDIVGYSVRSSPAQVLLQKRLRECRSGVFADLGVMGEVATQDAGDGFYAFFPERIDLPSTLTRLLSSWKERVGEDNRIYRDRMRLRLAATVGPTAPSQLGFRENTIVELSGLLNSTAARSAVAASPAADLVVLVSGRLYDDVVRPGHVVFPEAHFGECCIDERHYRGQAWVCAVT